MKITISQKILLKALQSANMVIKNNNQLPILNGVLFKVKRNDLQIYSSNMQVSIKKKLIAESDEEFSFVVNNSQLLEYIQTLNEGDLSLEIKDGSLKLKQGHSKAILAVLKTSEYPELVFDHGNELISLELLTLNKILRQIVISTAEKNIRPALSAIYLDFDEQGYLSIVGTDGYRLSLYKLKIKNNLNRSFLVPGRVFVGLLKDLKDKKIKIGYNNKTNQVIIIGKDVVMGIRLIEGEYPPYKRIIPETYSTKIEVSRDDLLSAVKQMAVFAKHSSNIVYCDITSSGVLFKTQAGSIGSGEVLVETTVSGENVELAFNYRYLLDYLAVIENRELELLVNGPLAPVKVDAVGMANFVHVIMPVKRTE